MKVFIASPRGFCAGVKRAIRIVERVLELHGTPLYVRHEIVHNRHVVEGLRDKGVVFVEGIHEVPPGSIVIFSAHGVARSVFEEAAERDLRVIDAACPLVTKVHREIRRHADEGREVVLIGHARHPEVEGTMGQVDTAVHLISTPREARGLSVEDPENLAYVSQTTLSIDETQETVHALSERFPGIRGPRKEDICYATQNRQNAVKAMVGQIDRLLVVGSSNSSNSNRLRELGDRSGVRSYLLNSADEIDLRWLAGVEKIGLTAGASAPEHLVQEVVIFLKAKMGGVDTREVVVAREDMEFSLPL